MKYPSVEAFAEADLKELEQDIRPTGFYHNKAKNIIACCQRLMALHGGEVPSGLEELTALPGVGRKTANVIRGNIFHEPSVVVDTHVKRISKKLGLTKEDDPEKVEYELMKVLPKDHWILYNIQIITLGRTICKAPTPKCMECFLTEWCKGIIRTVQKKRRAGKRSERICERRCGNDRACAEADKIIEIGAVRVRDGQIVESFTSFVNPGRILPAHITELTGILQEQVDEAETMERVLPAFLEFVGDLPLVGHRILFDYGFLKRAAVNMRLDFERSGVDTLKLSRQFLSELPSRRLSALCEHFEIPIQAHRALEDARATHILYEKLLELYGTDPDRAKVFEPVPLICKVKRESPATKAQKERLTKLLALHQLTPDYDVSMLTKNEASRQIDRILAAYGSLQK